MVIGKATAESEKEGALPDSQLMADMGKFNEELISRISARATSRSGNRPRTMK